MRWIKNVVQFVRNLLAPQPQLRITTTPEQKQAMGAEIRKQKARADLAGHITVED